MKLIYFLYSFVVLTSISCNKNNDQSEVQKSEIKYNGLTLYLSGFFNSNLQLTINDTLVFDETSNAEPGRIFKRKECLTSIRNSHFYTFNLRYSDCVKNFHLPAKELDSLIISEVSLFDIKHIEKKIPNKKKEFSFYISKNIANNCSVKIAADSDTLYKGLFLNNYPRRYYNSMKFTHTFSKKRFIEIYVEIFNNFTCFSIDTEKYDAVKITYDNHLVITTNLDEEWKRRNYFD